MRWKTKRGGGPDASKVERKIRIYSSCFFRNYDKVERKQEIWVAAVADNLVCLLWAAAHVLLS